MRLRLLLTMAMTVASVAVGSTVQAAPPRPEVTQAETAATAARAAIAQEVREATALEPFYDARTSTVDAPAALAAGVDATVITDFQSGLSWGTARGADLLSRGADIAAFACAGRTLHRHKFLYHEVWMNTCDVKALVGAMGVTGGAVALAGVIASLTGVGAPLGILVTIAGALLAIGGGSLNLCDRYSRGVVLDNIGWPCRSQ